MPQQINNSESHSTRSHTDIIHSSKSANAKYPWPEDLADGFNDSSCNLTSDASGGRRAASLSCGYTQAPREDFPAEGHAPLLAWLAFVLAAEVLDLLVPRWRDIALLRRQVLTLQVYSVDLGKLWLAVSVDANRR